MKDGRKTRSDRQTQHSRVGVSLNSFHTNYAPKSETNVKSEEALDPDARYQGLSTLNDPPSKTNSTDLHFS